MSTAWIGTLALALAVSAAAEEPWSRFRGPNGAGVAEGTGYPEKLGDPVWRAAVRPGKSSPVLTDTRIFLTAFDDGLLYTQCFDRATGELLWERAVERTRQAAMNRLNEPSAITPVTDGENVYALFRDLGLLSYDGEGALRWRTPLGPYANSMGHASSPVLAGGRLILQADQKHDSYIAALDTADGEIVWRTPPQEGEGWATPAVFGEGMVLTTSRGWLGAHAAADGKRLWGLQSLSPAIVASPAVVGDTVYTFGYGNESLESFKSGFDKRDEDGDGKLGPADYGSSPFMAGIARYDGDRDGVLTREEYLAAAAATIAPSRLFAFRLSASGPPRELWRYERSFNHVIPSPLVYEDVLYFVKNGGILEAVDAETGEGLKRGRLREAIGGYSASPVAADGKIYLASEDGKVTTVAAGPEWTVIETTDLGEEIFATPALSRGQIFVRTAEALYLFQNK